MLNSIISCPKVPKLIITHLGLSFIPYLRMMTITIVSSEWRGLWITGFQEVISKAVITRNVKTILYYDLQKKSCWMSFPCVLQQSCWVILCMELNSCFLFFYWVKSFFFKPTLKKISLRHFQQRLEKTSRRTVGLNTLFFSGMIAITDSQSGVWPRIKLFCMSSNLSKWHNHGKQKMLQFSCPYSGYHRFKVIQFRHYLLFLFSPG